MNNPYINPWPEAGILLSASQSPGKGKWVIPHMYKSNTEILQGSLLQEK